MINEALSLFNLSFIFAVNSFHLQDASPTNLFDGINFFVSGWIYAGLLFIASIYLTHKVGWVQFVRLKQMTACFFFSEKSSGENISPFKAIIASLASRFGLGNVVGVGLAILLAGPGVILWMIFFGLLSVGTAVCEGILAQIYKEKDPFEKGLYRGGTPYYILKGLGKNLKWLAFGYAILNIFAKGFFIVNSSVNSVTDVIGFSFFNNNYKSIGSGGFDPLGQWIIWVVVAIIALLVFITAFTGVKRIINVISRVAPIIIVFFLLFTLCFVGFNYNYLGDFIVGLFKGAVIPSAAFAGFAGTALAKTINDAAINGASRGIFANEAGQGSTTFSAATAKVDHPVRIGYSQGFVAFFDTAIICLASGIVYSIGLYKLGAINHDHMQDVINMGGKGATQFTYDVFTNFLPHAWNADHSLNWVGIIPLCIIILACGYMVISGCVLITEFSLQFIFKNLSYEQNKKMIKIYHYLVPVIIFVSPVIGAVSANVFTISDFLVAACFIFNIIAVISLLPTVTRVIADFKKQVKSNNDLKNQLTFDPEKVGVYDHESSTL